MENQPYCWIMVGAPGCGKSTWVHKNVFVAYTTVLSTDSLIEDYAFFHNKTYDQVFKSQIDEATKVFFGQLDYAVSRRKNIVVDRTNMSVKSRKKILDRIPEDYIKVAILVTCDDDVEVKRRLESRKGKSIPWHIVENMKKAFEEPTEAEGFSSVTRIKT